MKEVADARTPKLRRSRFANFPFAPSRIPFFYGWVVVGVGTIGTVLSIPGQTMGVSPFKESLQENLELTALDLSSAYMWGTLASACILPLAGSLFDRFGVRVMVIAAGAGLGLTLVYLSRCDEIAASTRSLFESDVTASFAVITLGFFFVRFWGQGVLTIASRNMLGKWFDRRRGLATAISGVSVSALFAASPQLLHRSIGDLGWRETWLILAAVCTAWAVIGGITYRDNPEECGLEMDGQAGPRSEDNAPPIEYEFSALEAMRTRAFWLSCLPLALFALLGTSMTFHLASIGRIHGLSQSESYSVFIPMTLVAILVNLTAGWLSDRVRARYLSVALLTGQALGCIGLIRFGDEAGRLILITGFGLTNGLYPLLMTIVWPRFFGRLHLGAISGINMALNVAASAIGPRLFAIEEASTERFDTSLITCAAIAGILAISSLSIENPQLARSKRAMR